MSKSNIVRYFVVLLFAAVTSVAIVAADFDVAAQNTNSGTATEEGGTQATNGNTGRRARSRARRRARRTARRTARRAARADMNTNATADTSGDTNMSQDNTNTTGTTGGDMSAGATGMQEDTSGGEQTDLSGTYTGTINMTGRHTMSGPATLTIAGNQFTLDAGGMMHTGRILAVTTRGYTGVTMRFIDPAGESAATGAGATPPVTVSVRARRTGDRLSLTSVPGESNSFTFTTPGAGGRRTTRRRG